MKLSTLLTDQENQLQDLLIEHAKANRIHNWLLILLVVYCTGIVLTILLHTLDNTRLEINKIILIGIFILPII
jgi:hypothetical protein